MTDERSFSHAPIRKNELLKLLKRYFKELDADPEFNLLSGGACNTSFHFRQGSTRYVLKIYARDEEARLREWKIHQLVRGAVATPNLVDSLDDPLYPSSLFEYVAGNPLDKVTTLSREELSPLLGKTLAALHNFTFKEAGLFDRDLHIKHPFPRGSSPYYEEARRVLTESDIARERFGKKLADQMLVFMDKNASLFPTIADAASLVHSDFKPCNLLYSKGNEVIVLDFEFAHAGHRLLDFAILLRHKETIPLDLNILEKSYRDCGGELPSDWISRAEVTDFVNFTTMMESPLERPKLLDLFKLKINRLINNTK